MIENTLQRHPAVAVAAAVGMPDVYTGELPICYIQLLPNMTTTEDELRAFAETEISERPAWPKHIHIVDSIPVTAVGKIFKPTLRRNAVKRAVDTILTKNKFTGNVTVTVGGPRGMRVDVKLSDAQQKDATRLQDLLDAYLFEATVTS
ncbi:hypothetical protein [Aliiglaciecola sp. LCG003]|uniref:AMP-binding enzyme n=1 Tax=Aliiglaciecola sp. LCG003 TaxID=3053655 RepID=UPI00257389AA|nr:hypothetical protein [Aliiglaciecola sp. LCG003]WJG11331.1 hypothetical protein QR722_16265 [Aliiglaciecola sp. LCG003]